MPIMQKQLVGKANLLESRFGDWIIHVWGLSVEDEI